MEKGFIFNVIDHERKHIQANENFANDFIKSIRDRCKDIQFATAVRTIERLNPFKRLMNQEV